MKEKKSSRLLYRRTTDVKDCMLNRVATIWTGTNKFSVDSKRKVVLSRQRNSSHWRNVGIFFRAVYFTKTTIIVLLLSVTFIFLKGGNS